MGSSVAMDNFDDQYWERMVNLMENPILNDSAIRDTVKQKKEKKKNEGALKDVGEAIVKKVKREESVKTCVVVHKGNRDLFAFVEAFKTSLEGYENIFKQSLLANLEKYRNLGYVVYFSFYRSNNTNNFSSNLKRH